MVSPEISRVFSFVYILVILAVALAGHVQAKFLKADLRWPAFRKVQGDLQPSLTDLLAFREPDNDPIFEKAMHVVDNLATQSTCHQAAAAQLLITCKVAGTSLSQEQGKQELLERAQSVYAVRVAVCETGEGRAAIPSACKPILDIPQRFDHEIDVVTSKVLASCLEALIAEHYYWTSYSNNRQDANTLCQATTIESTRLEALRSYEKLAQLLPEFRAALGSTRSQWLTFLKQQQEEIQHVNKLQQRNQDERQAQHKLELSTFRDAINVAKEGLHEVFQTMQRGMAGTDLDVTQTREALGYVLADSAKLRDLLREAITTTGEQHAELAAAQKQEMNSVHELALATTRALKDIQADTVVQDVSALLHRIRNGLDEISGTQSMQLASTEHYLQLNEELSAAQVANLALGEQMRLFSATLASELESASTTAGRVSTKLDKVNQALTRVEAVSTILNSLFAFISIPCQMVEHLHFSLLGVFAMPAVLMSFWKPPKYSYILMAFYVFLESLISLMAEYHDNIVACLQHLGHESRAIKLNFGFNLFGRHLIVAASVTVVLLCCFLFIMHSRRPQPKATFALKSIKAFDDLTLADRFYLENRLRNGKCLRLSRDRYRRAATVC